MEILSVLDPAFKPYGRVVEGYPVDGLLAALKTTPLPDAVAYTPRDEALHAAANAEAIGEALFGGMPFQLGWCNGHNTRLNCLEYHRDSEFNLGTEAFILLLAKQDEMENGVLDTAKVRAFRVPAGVLIEVYARGHQHRLPPPRRAQPAGPPALGAQQVADRASGQRSGCKWRGDRPDGRKYRHRGRPVGALQVECKGE